MKKKAKLNDTLEEFKKYFLEIKYLSKCKKISISKDLLQVLIERNDFQETKDILKFIQKYNSYFEINLKNFALINCILYVFITA